ncbi:Transcription factor fungi [Macrophomina phaseolina MS6]|uniref:Transcription factor fungi n=1 Tax=Macrophomina phaseolina (strain MS6) TaxID=1126212 RepID=K2RQ17_MACPH|nr:Transcription factor fungi [Macrophomina phaseolina MS6]
MFFSIVHQPSFELRLKQFFDAPESSPADPGWYALRHTVYACGKRKLLKDASVADFKETHSSAFPYFANALARHTEMIYYKSSMTAVQALAAMVGREVDKFCGRSLSAYCSCAEPNQAHYAQAIGAPTIEYALQSNAMRLAQSKALHRKVPHSAGLSQFEIQQRSLLFWSMYVHEKHIAHWSGRPSVRRF